MASAPILHTKINGNIFNIPTQGGINWSDLTNFLTTIGAGTNANNGGLLQKGSGGTIQQFTLLGPVDFGANYGIISSNYESRSTNTATTGVLNLSNTDAVAWRNNVNTADLLLAVNGSNQLMFNGTILVTGSSSGAVTSITAGTGLTGGIITNTGTIALATIGTAGTYFSVTTDSFGRVITGDTSSVIDFPMYIPGVPAGSATLIRIVMVRNVLLPNNLTASQAQAEIAATSNAILYIQKNGTTFGTCTFPASSAIGTFTTSGTISFVAGDILQINNQSSADSTLSGISINLTGIK
jgi:hypothetical protein